MRFHVGFSFRLKNLVKFIIPFLIGLGAYFGLPVLFGFSSVYALENYNTNYTLTLPEDMPQYFIDDINDNIISLQSDYNDIVVVYYAEHNWNGDLTDFYVDFFIIPKTQSQDIYIYYDWRFWIKSPSFSPSIYYYYFKYTNGNESVVNTLGYNTFIDCYVNNSCVTNNFSDNSFLSSNGDVFTYNDLETTPTNDSDVVVKNRYLMYYYYSSTPLIIATDSSNVNDSNTFYKTFVVNDTSYGVGDRLPTYYSLYVYDEPIPPEPDDSSIVDSVYWFTDNFTEYEVLVNIYILLFLYCISMIILKLLMIVKGVKW